METVYVSLAILFLGFINVILAYEFLGNPLRENKTLFKKLHRVIGYLFLISFTLIFVFMFIRLKSPYNESAKIVIHEFFALFAFIFLLVKIFIAKRFKKLSQYLFFLGTVFFVMTFAFVILAGGGKLLGAKIVALEKTLPVEVAMDGVIHKTPFPMPDKISAVERNFIVKCSMCHQLGQSIFALKEYKSEREWVKVIDRMREKTDKISVKDRDEIARYLSELAAQ